MRTLSNRHQTLIAAALAFLVFMAAGPGAPAQELRRPYYFFEGVIGEDDRIPLAAHEEPFSAIGRLNVAGFSALRQCTGFLIAPDVVATAAHCVYDSYAKKPLAAARFHFLAGWQRQKYVAHAIGKCIKILPGFTESRRPTLEQFSRDVAVIRLRKPVDIKPMSLASSQDIAAATALVHAGYSRDRRHMQTGDVDCKALEEHETLILNDCDTNRGASGGPVLVLTRSGDLKVAAVMVGGLERNQVNVAVKVTAVREFLESAECE